MIYAMVYIYDIFWIIFSLRAMSLKGETQAVLALQDIVSCDMNRAKYEKP